MPGAKRLPFVTLALGAFATVALGVFLFTLVVRDRFEAGYLGVGIILLVAAAVVNRR